MKTREKILITGAAIMLLLGILFGVYMLFIRDNNENDKEKEEENVMVESIDTAMYFARRSDAFKDETYALLIWKTDQEWGQLFLDEIEEAFEGLGIMIYTLDLAELVDYDIVRVETDVKELMKLTKPMIIPTLIIMKDGKSVFEQGGLTFKENIIEQLDKLGIGAHE